MRWELPATLQRVAIPDPERVAWVQHPLAADYIAFVTELQQRMTVCFLTFGATFNLANWKRKVAAAASQ